MEPEINEEKEMIIAVALLIVGGLIAGCFYLIDNNVFAMGFSPDVGFSHELSYQKLAVTVLFPYFVVSVIRLLRFVWRLIK